MASLRARLWLIDEFAGSTPGLQRSQQHGSYESPIMYDMLYGIMYDMLYGIMCQMSSEIIWSLKLF